MNEIKSKARAKLSSAFKSIIIFTIVCTILSLIILFCTTYFILKANNPKSIVILISTISILLTPAFSFGLSFSFYQLYTYSFVNPFMFIGVSFKYLIFSWKLAFRTFFETIFESLLYIVSIFFIALATYSQSTFLLILSGLCFIVSLILLIAKLLYFTFSKFIFFDNVKTSTKNALLKSKRLMLGNRLKLLLLRLSFIPAYIISAIIVALIPKFPGTIGLIFSLIISFCYWLYTLWISYYITFSEISLYKKLTTPSKKETLNSANSSYKYEMLEKAEQNNNLETFDTAENLETFDTAEKLENFDTIENIENNKNNK